MKNPFAFIGRWWRRRLRKIDKKILFPRIHELAGSDEKAAVMIVLHIATDPAWRFMAEWAAGEPEISCAIVAYVARAQKREKESAHG